MKLNGVPILKRFEDFVVLPREGSDDLVFRLVPVDSYEDFNKLCPEPRPPRRKLPGQEQSVPVYDSPKYVAAMSKHNRLSYDYMCVKTFADVEWDTVDINNPETWANWTTDFLNAGIRGSEFTALMNGIMKINSLNSDHLEEARERFLAMRRQQSQATPSQTEELTDTQSGELVSDSDSDLLDSYEDGTTME